MRKRDEQSYTRFMERVIESDLPHVIVPFLDAYGISMRDLYFINDGKPGAKAARYELYWWMFMRMGWSICEIARFLDRSESSVRKRLQGFRDALNLNLPVTLEKVRNTAKDLALVAYEQQAASGLANLPRAK